MFKLICGGVHRSISRNSLRSLNVVPRLRYFSDDSNVPMGGGLEKLQGGLKEESYFQTQNYELIKKIREQGSKLKCENCLGDWDQFEKTFDDASNVLSTTALRESCCLNKHKNCLEEAFFMNEQNDCTQIIKDQISSDSPNFEFNKSDNFEDTKK